MFRLNAINTNQIIEGSQNSEFYDNMNLTFLSSELHLNSNSYFEILEIQFKRTTPQFQTSESVYLSEVVELSLLKQLNNVFHQVASWEMYFTLKTLSLPHLSAVWFSG